MTWRKEIDELERRRALARRMGGEEGIARQRKRGKLTVRERLDALADPGSFREFLGLMGHGVYDGERLVDFTPKPSVEGILPRRRAQGRGHRRRLHGARRLGWQRPRARQRAGRRAARARVAGAPRAAARLRRRQRALVRGDRPHLPARRQHLDRDRRPTAARGAGGVGRARLGRGAAGGERLHGALQPDVARHRPRLSGRAAGGEGRARLRHHQGGPRRRAHPRPRERRDRQPGRDRGGRVRADPPLPLVPARQRLGAGAARRDRRRSGRGATRRCCPRSRAIAASPSTLTPSSPRGRSRIVLRDRPGLRPVAHHRARRGSTASPSGSCPTTRIISAAPPTSRPARRRSG